MDDEQVRRNIESQRALYGSPLGEIGQRITGTLHITQARLASALGISAPMLSQLIKGQRVKIGNPAVMPRLESIIRLVEEAEREPFDPGEVEKRLIASAGETRVLTTTEQASGLGDAARVVRQAIRASGEEDALRAAVAALAEHPQLARLVEAAAFGDVDTTVHALSAMLTRSH